MVAKYPPHKSTIINLKQFYDDSKKLSIFTKYQDNSKFLTVTKKKKKFILEVKKLPPPNYRTAYRVMHFYFFFYLFLSQFIALLGIILLQSISSCKRQFSCYFLISFCSVTGGKFSGSPPISSLSGKVKVISISEKFV